MTKQEFLNSNGWNPEEWDIIEPKLVKLFLEKPQSVNNMFNIVGKHDFEPGSKIARKSWLMKHETQDMYSDNKTEEVEEVKDEFQICMKGKATGEYCEEQCESCAADEKPKPKDLEQENKTEELKKETVDKMEVPNIDTKVPETKTYSISKEERHEAFFKMGYVNEGSVLVNKMLDHSISVIILNTCSDQGYQSLLQEALEKGAVESKTGSVSILEQRLKQLQEIDAEWKLDGNKLVRGTMLMNNSDVMNMTEEEFKVVLDNAKNHLEQQKTLSLGHKRASAFIEMLPNWKFTSQDTITNGGLEIALDSLEKMSKEEFKKFLSDAVKKENQVDLENSIKEAEEETVETDSIEDFKEKASEMLKESEKEIEEKSLAERRKEKQVKQETKISTPEKKKELEQHVPEATDEVVSRMEKAKELASILNQYANYAYVVASIEDVLASETGSSDEKLDIIKNIIENVQ